MKLSEAIRMNGMMKPQGFGPDAIISADAPCAIGGALQSVGRQSKTNSLSNYGRLLEIWPFARRNISNCPASDCCDYRGLTLNHLETVLWHLNDVHAWTRQQIADWVATVEPQEEHADGGQGPGVAVLEESVV